MEGLISPPINSINTDHPPCIPQVHVSNGGLNLQRNHDLESRKKRPRDQQEFVENNNTHSSFNFLRPRSISTLDKSIDRLMKIQDAEGDSQKGMPDQRAKMRVPRLNDSLSWGKQRMSIKDTGVSKSEKPSCETDGHIKPPLSANHLAAKVIQLRMKGKHEEAEKLQKEAEGYEGKNKAGTITTNLQDDGTASRYIMHNIKTHEKKKEEDADMHVARLIMQNRQCSTSGQADYEYDYDEEPKRKKQGKDDDISKSMRNTRFQKHILTQQERWNFCFENPKRPRHLVIAVANFTYLMLPQWKPVVPGHCCILPITHELATRNVDDNVWDEVRNFKKCLLMMFAKQEMDVIFLETVMGLAKQNRHCMVECIPLPPGIAKQAPLYFKKAIDEAEEEWSQHNAKKLIDTSEKWLCNSIPKDFPYFHVEFGLKKGYVHVIDDESQFKGSFGINVIRGMLCLPAEDMHCRQKHEPIDTQKEAVANFGRNWEPFDWTKQLD